MEIERKFLVTNPPLEKAVTGSQIRQGYLAIDDKRVSSVRIRQEGDLNYTLTAKAEVPGLGMVARHEAEIYILGSQFERLWPLTAGNRVEKARHCIPLTPSLTAEVDCFDHGLQMVEVEFKTIEDADAFQPPEWFGREVTNDPQFTNAWIARHGNPLHLQGPA
jgi:adenylate cyclase